MSYPNNRHGNTPPYLLSAYGIAVKHGYSGSEEEWLASLKGDQGEYPRMQFDSETGYLQIRYDDSGEWTDIASLADLMTESEETVVASAKEYADTAEAYAKGTVDGEAVEEDDPGYEDNAKYYAGQASDSATAAAGSASDAASSAASALSYKNLATQQAQLAQTQAAAAANSANSAATAQNAAYTYAGSASTSAQSAQAQAVQAGTYAYNADQSAQQAASYAAASGNYYAQIIEVANGVAAEADDVEAYVTAAAAAQTAAETAATNASGSATAAAGSATDAAGSATAAAASAATAGENAEAWAAGTRGGQPVPSTDEAYENNSKYYAEQAADVLDSIPEDYSEMSDDVAELQNAIVDNYYDKNKDGQTLLIDKSDAKLGIKDLTANLPYSANGYTGINLRHMGARLYVKYGDGINIDRDTGGVKTSTGYQIVGPIDVRNADTLYVNYHHGGAGYQVTAAGYSGTDFESFVGFIYKGNNTQGTADVSYTWNVSEYNYVYFSCRNGETYMRVSTYRTNDGVQFTDGGETLTIYGGTYDYTTGLLTSLYAADGTELETPVTYQFEPMSISLIDGTNEFITTPSTNGYLFVGTLEGTYLVSAIPDIRGGLETAEENIASLMTANTTLTATSADLQADVVPFPDYYTEQINANIPAIRLNMKNVGMDGFTFFFITDSHWKQNSKNSPKLIQRIGKTLSIETILHGGDIVQDSATTTNYLQGTDTMRQLKRTGKVFAALGNHDFDAKDPDGTTVVLTADQASGLMQQQEAYWMRKYADGHYYADVDGYRTRIIVLNTGDHNHHGTMQSRELDEEQRAFLNDALDTVPTGWHIIVLQHIWRQDSVTVFATAVAQILDAYNADESSPGKVEAVFCGHKHTDYNTTTPGGIPVIESTCDRRKSDAEQGTTDEGAFDTVTIDYANSVIYLVRTGRGESRTISYGA